MRLLLGITSLAAVTNAHTLFTTLFINGHNQGDGTCVRMPKDDDTATSPVYPIDGSAMACGRDGETAVKYICNTPSQSTLTFEFRTWPGGQHAGAIDKGHLGPCSVYVKKVDDMFSDSASGPGWFKIWQDGYDQDSKKWCVDRLIENNGLLSVDLPKGLPKGYYLVRTEILALHDARRGDPQFYVGCAQIFINDGPDAPLTIPDKSSVSIPGYVNKNTPGVKFDIYQEPVPAYPVPGPAVYIPTAKSRDGGESEMKQAYGVIPEDCLVRRADWCAKPIPPYSGEDACWDAVHNCYNQSKKCWEDVPPTGATNCYTWQDYCKQIDNECTDRNFDGPPKFEGKEKYAPISGNIPNPYNEVPALAATGSSS